MFMTHSRFIMFSAVMQVSVVYRCLTVGSNRVAEPGIPVPRILHRGSYVQKSYF